MCEDARTGYGTVNWGQYCNPKMDAVLDKALYTMDDKERSRLLQEATAIVVDDGGIIPVHFEVTTWAARKGFTYTPRTNERTYAQGFKSQSCRCRFHSHT